jgi:hypothetical protein
MIHLEMSTRTSEIRAYDQPGGYEQRLPYLAIVTVTHLTDRIVYLSGAKGMADRETWEALLDLLLKSGVTTVMLERRGRMKTIDLRASPTGGS